MKPSELLADPKSWTQCTRARNAAGVSVESNDPEAVCWCIIGAISKTNYWIKGHEALVARVWQLTGRGSIAGWNDAAGRTHGEVLELLRSVGL